MCSRLFKDTKFEVLNSWDIPYPGCPPSQQRPKKYEIVRFGDGCLAFCKSDSAPQYIAHEAEILRALGNIENVPPLLHQTSEAIYTKYIKGELLPQAIGKLALVECVSIGWRILSLVSEIHKKGVVHSDIRPWNFICGEDGILYLIDFEYAYSRDQKNVHQLLSVHHGRLLKTALNDWSDALKTVSDTWKASGYRLVRFALAYVPLGFHWALRPVLSVQKLGLQFGMFTRQCE